MQAATVGSATRRWRDPRSPAVVTVLVGIARDRVGVAPACSSLEVDLGAGLLHAKLLALVQARDGPPEGPRDLYKEQFRAQVNRI